MTADQGNPRAPSDPEIVKILNQLANAAWAVREHAHIIGTTKVGCALLATDGTTFTGCNVEHRFRSHDVHAEVNAISSMAAHGKREIAYLVVVAERTRFTPCGACMDWIMQFAAPKCLIAFQSRRNGEFTTYLTDELMPFYPH